jgi:hypothetical protein
MRPRTSVLGRHDPGSEKESIPLASEQSQGRRRAVRAQSLAILHKVGCSWSARPPRLLRTGSAGPTTQPRFEPIRSRRGGRHTGEPTVSHEGCSGFDFSFSLYRGLSRPLCAGKAGAFTPPRVASRGSVSAGDTAVSSASAKPGSSHDPSQAADVGVDVNVDLDGTVDLDGSAAIRRRSTPASTSTRVAASDGSLSAERVDVERRRWSRRRTSPSRSTPGSTTRSTITTSRNTAAHPSHRPLRRADPGFLQVTHGD